MLFFVGMFVVIGCVLVGYIGAGGHLVVLWQPLEYLIIFGAAIGGFIIANPMWIIKGAGGQTMRLMTGNPYNKDRFNEMLVMMFTVFKFIRTKGVLGIEKHIEHPHESDLFGLFPKFQKDHAALDFFCDYLRIISMGVTNQYQLEDVMNADLDKHHSELHRVQSSIATIADGMPALGIVAAVLGVIHTMGSITEPPEVLGHLIGAALVGTFSGVLFAYGFIGPMAKAIENAQAVEAQYFQALKMGIMGYLQGQSPQVLVEFVRRGLDHDVQPTFAELEELCKASSYSAA